MTIPQKLALELQAELELLTQDGELPAPSRQRILQLIEEISSTEHANAGYLRRARLGIICAQEVLEKIDPYVEVKAAAVAMLKMGIAALSGRCALTELQKENGNFHTKVIDLFEFGESAFVPAYAGMAAFAAINTVLYDTNFDVLGEDEKTVSPDDWDAGFYGSLAASGSAVWEEKGGKESRATYWQWYLGRAIPNAWDVTTPLDVE